MIASPARKACMPAQNAVKPFRFALASAYPYNTAECFRLKADVAVDRVEALAAIAEREFEAWSRA